MPIKHILLPLKYYFLGGLHPQHMEVPRLGVESELQLLAYATATATGSRAASANYTAADGNARSLTHWARPGMEPASSWILVRFVTCWATRETPNSIIFKCSGAHSHSLIIVQKWRFDEIVASRRTDQEFFKITNVLKPEEFSWSRGLPWKKKKSERFLF